MAGWTRQWHNTCIINLHASIFQVFNEIFIILTWTTVELLLQTPTCEIRTEGKTTIANRGKGVATFVTSQSADFFFFLISGESIRDTKWTVDFVGSSLAG